MESSGAGEKNNINPRPSDSALENGIESGRLNATQSNSEIESRVHSQIVEIVHRSPELTQDDVSNIADLLKKLIRFDRLSISSFNKDDGLLTYGPAVGISTAPVGSQLKIDSSRLESDYSASNIKVFDVEDIKNIPSRFPGTNNLMELGVRSMISIALRQDGDIKGFVTLMSKEHGAFGASESAMLSRLSSSVSSALTGSLIFNERVSNLETSVRLREIAAHLVEALIEDTSVDNGLSTFARELTFELKVDMVTLSALGKNADGNYQMFGYNQGIGELFYDLTPEEIPFRMEGNESISNTVVAGLEELEKHRDNFPRLNRLLNEGMMQLSTTPLRWRGENVGWITTWNSSASADQTLLIDSLEEVASNISSSIGYIQINQRLEDDFGVQSAIAEMSTALSSSETFETGIESLVNRVRGLLGRGRPLVSIYGSDPLSIIEAYSFETSGGTTRTSYSDTRVPLNIEELSIADSSAHISEERMQRLSQDFEPFAEAISRGETEFAGVRMRWQGMLVGSLGVYYKPSEPYQIRDLELLDRISSGISGAMGTLILNRQLAKSSEIESAVAELGQAVSSSQTMETAFDQLVPLVERLIEFDEIRITLVDIETGTLNLMFDSTEDELEMKPRVPRSLEGSHTSMILADKAPVRVVIGEGTPTTSNRPRIIEPNDRGFKAGIGVQLVSDGIPFGALILRSKSADAYENVPDELVWRISDQISGSIAYHRVNDRLASEVREQTALSRIGQIVGSELEIESVFEEATRELARLIEFDVVMVTMPSEDNSMLKNLVVAGPNADEFRNDDWFPNGGSIVTEAIHQNAPVRKTTSLIPDPEAPGAFRTSLKLGMQSALAIPLVSEGEGFAVLQFRSKEPNAYDELRDDFLFRVAAQVAGAMAYDLVSARLEQEVVQQQTLAEIGQIVGSELDLVSVFGQVSDKLKTLIDFEIAFVAVPDEQLQTVRLVLASGDGIEEHLNHSVRLNRGSIVYRTLESGRPLRDDIPTAFVSDDPDQFDISESLGMKSALSVPLVSEGRSFAVMSFRSPLQDAYDEVSDNLLIRMSEQIAGAVALDLANSRLEEELRQQTVLSEIGRLLGSSSSVDSVFDDIADEISNIVEFEAIWMSVIDHETQTFENRFVSGRLAEFVRTDTIDFTENSLNDLVMKSEDAVRGARLEEHLIDGTNHVPKMIKDFHAAYAVPLINDGQVVGTLQMRSSDPDAFPHSIKNFLTLAAEQISGAMARAELASSQLILGLERERAQGLQSKNEDLERLRDVREQFLGMVTHELRTPLTSISAFADILGHNREGTLTDRQFQQLNAISRNSAHLGELIDDLIHMSSMERGQFELTFADTDVVALVQDVCESMAPVLQHRRQAIAPDIQVQELVLGLDQSRFTQVINNLISNASKFSPEDSRILVEMRNGESEVRICVSDEGPGIAPEEEEAVFDPFYRIDAEAVRSVPGTGLGLYVARNIVRQHGGELAVVPGTTSGSTLQVTLPVTTDK